VTLAAACVVATCGHISGLSEIEGVNDGNQSNARPNEGVREKSFRRFRQQAKYGGNPQKHDSQLL
jgi:hypothetical protein